MKKIVSVLVAAGLVAGFALMLGLNRAHTADDKETTRDKEEPAIPVILQDAAFERFVDIRLIGRAVSNLDSALLTDLALELAEGERVLLRPHKGLPTNDVVQSALKLARKKRDKASLERLAKYAKKHEDKDLADEVATALTLVSTGRAAPPLTITADIPEEQLSLYKGFIAQIDSAAFLADAKALAAVSEDVKKLDKSKLPEKLKADLVKRILAAMTEVKAGATDTQKTLSMLSDSTRDHWAVYKRRNHHHGWAFHGTYRSHNSAEREVRQLERYGWFARVQHHHDRYDRH